MTNLRNAEFQNLKLAQIYEAFNQFSEDESFWLGLIKDLNISHITDFGCGTGLLTHRLMELGYTVRGVEPAKAMLEQAKNKKGSHRIEYIEGDYKKLEKSSTELILMTSHVAQFIGENEWGNFLQQSYEALRDGGYILFDSKNPILKPWKRYTREAYNITKQTQFGQVNMQIETTYIKGNIMEHTIYYTFHETKEVLISKNMLIYRTKEELERDLINAGFEIAHVYGGWDFGDYSNDCEEMIFLVKK